MTEVLNWEVSIQPPPIDELRRSICGVFSNKWIKYTYAKFKNECPNGRMRIQEFKNLFGAYLPSRISNAYINRLFFAFSRNQETLTFQDLVETLAMLTSPSALSNAHWMMRLIKGSDDGTISYTEFKTFVRSLFHETDKEVLKNNSTASSKKSSVLLLVQKKSFSLSPIQKKSSAISGNRFIDNDVDKRAEDAFSILDRNNDGLVELEDLVDFFQREDRMDPLASCARPSGNIQNK
ncbi:Kv channel-interacting protein 2 [Toxocara canis]|uniref:Kv channel-interacting protein 2 n=1 Tax=Toxocara canis TaxID=6265 RepID=A0A0B2VIQ0_TOXCA|nr:Kv channel-interacting protein 2 [Toxocara canis]